MSYKTSDSTCCRPFFVFRVDSDHPFAYYGNMEPMIINVFSWLGVALGLCAAGYTLYERVRGARKREAAKSAARP